MNRLELWFLKKIIAKQVKQGRHMVNTRNLYELIREAWIAEFTEDNIATTDVTLREIFESTQHYKKSEL